MTLTPLTTAFFDRPTLDVAPELLGKLLVREPSDGGRSVGRIVETEAYTQDDPAFHAWGIVDGASGLIKPEGRGFDLFGKPGSAYIYLVYGMYWMLNVVTEREGVCGVALIRALEPVSGIDAMFMRRPAARSERDLASGPGKLAQAMDVDKELHGTMLTQPPLYFATDLDFEGCDIETSCRIGITRGVDLPRRYYIRGNPHVSPGIPSDIAAERRRLRGSGRRAKY